ncbi:tRNA N6-adenosine threonylcarbamoyltransferase [Yarrowia sp. B02]|nr:tRNA N6-adenosine threonylcarbamoyltransferase [Yarrowia sp. B02]
MRSVLGSKSFRRLYNVLAIESSCDDTCAALISRDQTSARLVDHVKVTLDSSIAGGVNPALATAHHHQTVGPLVSRFLKKHPDAKIDLVCATRGPGLPGCLSSGVTFAKGLAVGLGVPYLGVHHMLAHLLTPRLFEAAPGYSGPKTEFPFLSLLVSGGHTMLVLSKSLYDHTVLCNTADVAIGDALDKCARELGLKGNMLGKVMDQYCRAADTPSNLWNIPIPVNNKNDIRYSFAAFHSFVAKRKKMTQAETTPELALEVQSAIFNHLIRKTASTLDAYKKDIASVSTLVCSGGVAANPRLRQSLEELCAKYKLQAVFPDPYWCTDNAAMIGWAGIELHEDGYRSDLEGFQKPKWPLAEFEKEVQS